MTSFTDRDLPSGSSTRRGGAAAAREPVGEAPGRGPDGRAPDRQGLDGRVVERARTSTALLQRFNEAGALGPADVHVADRLGELGGEPDERVRLAVALIVRAVRRQSVCLELDEIVRIDPDLPWPAPQEWWSAIRASPLVGPGLPVREEFGLLYLDRYWNQEVQVCADLTERDAQAPPPVDRDRLAAALDRLFGSSGGGAGAQDDQAQREAVRTAATRWTTVISGGPGTGKTTTVARLLGVLTDQPGPPLRIGLAAPTGKAAARLQEAVQLEAVRFPAADRERVAGLTASTLHRLLGWTPASRSRFVHRREHRLPHDLVVVDEASMLSLTLTARLLEALRPDARLILVGDPDQLASVEAGAVLADLVAGLTDRRAGPPGRSIPAGRPAAAAIRDGGSVRTLSRIWRFGGRIAELADAVREGDAEAALAVFEAGDPAVTATGSDAAAGPPDRMLQQGIVRYAEQLAGASEAGDAARAFEILDDHRLLCGHRTGPAGVQTWNERIDSWIGRRGRAEWYPGRPLLVVENDIALGLFNGDTGVVIRRPDGAAAVVFGRGTSWTTLAPSRLAGMQTAFAMTVHRSQGSQYRSVTLVLPPLDSPLLTRELLYTGVTRAREQVRVIGSSEQIRAALGTRATRASGLRERLGEHRRAQRQSAL